MKTDHACSRIAGMKALPIHHILRGLLVKPSLAVSSLRQCHQITIIHCIRLLTLLMRHHVASPVTFVRTVWIKQKWPRRDHSLRQRLYASPRRSLTHPVHVTAMDNHMRAYSLRLNIPTPSKLLIVHPQRQQTRTRPLSSHTVYVLTPTIPWTLEPCLPTCLKSTEQRHGLSLLSRVHKQYPRDRREGNRTDVAQA